MSGANEPENVYQFDNDVVDPVIRMVEKTGCLERHYRVQECISEKQDWRQCQDEVKDFKKCMNEYEERKFANKIMS